MKKSFFIPPEEINVLLLEDDEFDMELVVEELCKKPKSTSKLSPIFNIHCVKSLKAGMANLYDTQYDVILLDVYLKDSKGLKSLTSISESFPDVPVVILTGVLDEDFAIKAFDIGAQDFLIKGERQDVLSRTIIHAIQRKNFLKELQKAELKAKNATEAKSSFLANMSHEIRTPLTGILGFADIAGEETFSKKQENAIKGVKRNGEHLLQVINDILDLSKIEAGKVTIDKQKFNIFTLIEELESTFKIRAEQVGLEFLTEINFPIPEIILADQFRIKQILINLIGNAIKFTDKGSVKLKIEFENEFNKIGFHIIDTGIGLELEKQRDLFKPFTQADISTTRKYGGSGLGLSISKQLVELHSGFISVKSDYGKGSKFSFYIPPGDGLEKKLVLEKSEPSVKKIDPKNNPQVKLSGKVLIVDDMPDNRELISYFLEQCNLDVVSAENGREALKALEREHFDLVLLDMQMPIMDGYECIGELRARGYKVPVVALTASTLSDAIGRCIRAGCNSYMRKPFNKDEFIDMVKEYLGEVKETQVIEDSPIVPEIAVGDSRMAKIVLNFVNGLPERVKALDTSYSAKEWSDFKLHAHKLAGAKMFGFEKIGDAASILEKLIDNDAFDEIETTLSEVKNMCNGVGKTKEALNDIINEKGLSN